MSDTIHAAKISVSLDKLCDALGLPLDTKILAIEASAKDIQIDGCVTLYIEHPGLPEMYKGDKMMRIQPVFRFRCFPEFESWGLD